MVFFSNFLFVYFSSPVNLWCICLPRVRFVVRIRCRSSSSHRRLIDGWWILPFRESAFQIDLIWFFFFSFLSFSIFISFWTFFFHWNFILRFAFLAVVFGIPFFCAIIYKKREGKTRKNTYTFAFCCWYFVAVIAVAVGRSVVLCTRIPLAYHLSTQSTSYPTIFFFLVFYSSCSSFFCAYLGW